MSSPVWPKGSVFEARRESSRSMPIGCRPETDVHRFC
jgi:hypothetical protein